MGKMRGGCMALLWCCTTLVGQPIRQAKRTSTSLLRNPIKDIFVLHKNLISGDSLKVFILSAPLYALAYSQDKRAHACFYDEHRHANIRQLPRTCSEIAKYGIGAPILILGSFAFLSHDTTLRTTSYAFLLGLPFVMLCKDIIKKWHIEPGKRPRNGLFSKNKCYYGGFPSGHLAQAVYMTVLFGSRYGPKAWVPLGALSIYTFAAFVNCNRHFMSQMIAGGIIGTMYGIAANKLVDYKLAPFKHVGVYLSPRGQVELKASFRF